MKSLILAALLGLGIQAQSIPNNSVKEYADIKHSDEAVMFQYTQSSYV